MNLQRRVERLERRKSQGAQVLTFAGMYDQTGPGCLAAPTGQTFEQARPAHARSGE